MKYLIALFFLLAPLAWAADLPYIPPGSGSPAQAGTAGCNSVNCQAVFADRRAPTINDDVTGNYYPGSSWCVQNPVHQCWKNISNGLGQAVWQPRAVPPLPADVLGLYVSAAPAIQAAGTGYNVGNTITLPGGVVLTVATLTGGAGTGVATVTVTTPNMYACAATDPVAQSVTSGGGTGATFNLASVLKFPFAYGRIRMSRCYTTSGRNTGNLMVVTNSVTGATTSIPYVPGTNVYDWPIAVGPLQMAEYTAYNTGPTPNVTTLYDQGGTTDYAGSNTTDATQATLAQAPVIFPGKISGNAPPITFNANGPSGSNGFSPSITKLTLPAAVSISGANAAVISAGGAMGLLGGFGYAGPSAGSHYFGINLGIQGAPVIGNAADNGALNAPFNTMIAETPSVYGFTTIAGVPVLDSTFSPANLYINTGNTVIAHVNGSVVAGDTGTLTISGGNISASGACGSNCESVTYTATASDAAAVSPALNVIAGLEAAVNADPVLASAGFTCQLGPQTFLGYMQCYFPIGTPANAWGFTQSHAGAWSIGTGGAYTSGAGGTYTGGAIGAQAVTASPNTGLVTEDAFILVPWALNSATLHGVRESLNYWLGYTPQYSVRIMADAASNFTGYETPFVIGQTLTSYIPGLLGRSDVAIFNPSAAGQQIATIYYNNGGYSGSNANGYISGTAIRTHVPNASNNITYVQGTYNDFLTVSFTGVASGGILTVSGISGALAPGMVVTGSGFSATITGTILNGGGLTGAAGNGTYSYTPSSQSASSEAMTSVGSAASLLTIYQAITAQTATALVPAGGTVGDILIASPEPTKNAGNYSGGGTMSAQMQAFAALLTAPGALSGNSIVVNPQALAVFNGTVARNWTWPWYENNASGTHLSAAGGESVASQLAKLGLYPRLQ